MNSSLITKLLYTCISRRKHCNNGTGHPPIYVNVHMKSGEVINNWIDALQAAWPGVQVTFEKDKKVLGNLDLRTL